jgi:hypothetical protein
MFPNDLPHWIFSIFPFGKLLGVFTLEGNGMHFLPGVWRTSWFFSIWFGFCPFPVAAEVLERNAWSICSQEKRPGKFPEDIQSCVKNVRYGEHPGAWVSSGNVPQC